jgi:hypothetical protein
MTGVTSDAMYARRKEYVVVVMLLAWSTSVDTVPLDGGAMVAGCDAAR